MAKFARDCRDKTVEVTLALEKTLGPVDISHTMQHFSVYKKWYMRLLTEVYEAYKMGRTAKDPLDGWYEGDLWFFDNYGIPLVQKLVDCGAFGASCDEFLYYAKDTGERSSCA
jgi:hypothetical protein